MKLDFVCGGCVAESVGRSNIAYAKTLGLPAPKRGGAKRLAIVGGGHSAAHHVERIQMWPDDRWIIGSAFQWCRQSGISGTFFCCAPSKDAIPLMKGASHAIVASCSDPGMFEALRGTYTEVFDIENNGATSATVVPWLALQMGYEEIRFFGCDSSFSDTTHHYMSNDDWRSRLLKRNEMEVSCNGQRFRTCPEFYMQAIFLSELMRSAPYVMVNCSGGLLEAMCEDKNYDVVSGTMELYNHLGINNDRISENCRT